MHSNRKFFCLGLLFFLLCFSSFSAGRPDPSDPSRVGPHIELSPDILNFIAMQNGILPPPRTFTIFNSGGDTLNWSLSHSSAWLEVSPDSGKSDSAMISVSINTTNLSGGAHYDTIVVSSSNADNSPQIIPVNYYLSPAASGPDPGIPDTVRVDRIASVPPNTHLPPVYVYLINDERIGSFCIPLAFPDTLYDYDVSCDYVIWTDRIPRVQDMSPYVDNRRNLIYLCAVWFSGQLEPGNGPIAEIYFSTGPDWRADFSVPINPIPRDPFPPLQFNDSTDQTHWVPVFNNGALDVKENEQTTVPGSFELSQNYPNPFNPTTTIPFRVGGSPFTVHSPIPTTLKIYNILGQLVRTLVDVEKAPGNYDVIWDGKDKYGREVSSGIYFYRLKTGEYAATKKMVLLR